MNIQNEDDFFKTQTPSSRIKASIVAEYFPRYCRILLKSGQKEIRYMDLFAGPGIYQDGSHSTPLLIAKACADDETLRTKVNLIFNDNAYSDVLKENFLAHYPNGTFTKDPRFGNKTVGEDPKIYDYLTRPAQKTNPTPTLLFFDPWGYKGVDTLALSKFLSHWGNEIFLFVNIKRINAAIVNDKFDDLMKALFPTSIEDIRKDRKYKATAPERLTLIMDNLANEFKKAVGSSLYHCAFKFQEEDSHTTSHFIIHFTKHAKGYELVKQIYYDFDNIGASLEKAGVYTFDAKKMDAAEGFNFGDTNVEDLSAALEQKYKGRELSARKLFDEHQHTGDYCGSHYVKTFRDMVDKGKISVKFTDDIEHRYSAYLTPTCILKFN